MTFFTYIFCYNSLHSLLLFINDVMNDFQMQFIVIWLNY